MSFFKKLFSKTPLLSFEQRLASLNQGIYLCAECSKAVKIEDYEPLKLENCPHCGDLFLVPALMADWWVIKPLGSGGMGAVYMAHHKDKPQIKAAVKILQRGEDNQQFLELLIAEAKLAYGFGKHPHIAQTYAYGYSSDSAYMIMQMIEGTRLDTVLEARGRIHPELATYFMYDILTAIEHIYSVGYLYRDLKPENIIIRPDMQAVLVDYGLCMTIDEAWYYNGDNIMGSPLYMPPERIQGMGEDFRADFYALGMVYYHIVQGKPFFDDDEIIKIVQRQIKQLRVNTKHKLSEFDPGMAMLVDQLCRFSRDERPVSYAAIREQMIAILHDLARRPTDNCDILMRREQFTREGLL